MFKPQTAAEIVAMTKKATKFPKPRKQMNPDELGEAYVTIVTCNSILEGTSKGTKRGLSVEEAYAEVRAEVTQGERGRAALERIEAFAL